jgi:hypothetical protein
MPEGRTRLPGRLKSPDRDRDRADPLRGRTRRRRHRQRASNPVAACVDGPVLRPVGNRADGSGFGATGLTTTPSERVWMRFHRVLERRSTLLSKNW